jgi:tetratricopeptide (TPR) repeat protein
MAIDAFNRGLAQGEDPAAAYNGLGVAYARIGRSDLAYRFFKKAAMSEPDNPVYWRNLAILIDTPEFRLAAAHPSKPEVPAANLTAGDLPSVVPPKAQGVQLVRNGNHQFSLVTATTETAPANAGTNAALVSCDTNTKANPCRQRALPVSGSRNQNSPRNALAKGETSRSPSPSSVPAVPTGETQAPSGKRKIVDLSGLKSEAGKDNAKPKAPVGSNEPA